MADSDASSGSSSSSSSDSVLIRVPLDQNRRQKLRAQLQEDQRRQLERQLSAADSSRTPKLEADAERMKEHICVVCECEGDNLVVCAGPCISAFHVKCLPPSSEAADAVQGVWLCPNCKSKTHACFHCKETGMETLTDESMSSEVGHKPVRKCRALSCGKFYHHECITQFPLARIAINTHFICPLHTCATCNQSGAQQEAVRCMRCPVAYHAKCLPRQCVRQISSKLIICPNHSDKKENHRKWKEGIEDDRRSEASGTSTGKKKKKREKRDKKKKKKKKKKVKHKREHGHDDEMDESSGKKRKRCKKELADDGNERPWIESKGTVGLTNADTNRTVFAAVESPASASRRIQECLEEALGKSDEDSDGSRTSSVAQPTQEREDLSGQSKDVVRKVHEQEALASGRQEESRQTRAIDTTNSPIPSSPVPVSPFNDEDSFEAQSSADEGNLERKRQKERQENALRVERTEQVKTAEGETKLEVVKPLGVNAVASNSKLKHVISEGIVEGAGGSCAPPSAETTVRTPRGSKGYGKKKRKNKVKRETPRSLKRDMSEDEEEEVSEAKWVQCDSCKKWRTVPKDFNLDAMPKHWYCHMNTWDTRFASCAVAEEVVKTKLSPPANKNKRRNKLKVKSKSTASSAGDDIGYSSNESGRIKRSGGANRGSMTDVTLVDEKEKSGRPKHKDKGTKKRKMTKQLKEKYREVKWVQCESTQCGKWRVVPSSINFDRLPAVWYCHLNTWAPELAKCSAPNPTEVDTIWFNKTTKEGRVSKKARAASVSGNVTPASSVATTASGGGTSIVAIAGVSGINRVGMMTGQSTFSVNSCAMHSVKGRGGRTHNNTNGTGVKKTVLEWAQCEKCNKWRKLPQHIKSSTLPDKWYCSMNHWDLSRAKCSIPEEADQEPLPVAPHSGSRWHKVGHKGQRPRRGKLSYSDLLYGSTGQLRKAYTLESSTLSFEYEGTTYYRDDQYKNSSMYVSPAAMSAAATMAGWSDQIMQETQCNSDVKVDALAPPTPPQASIDQVAAVLLESMDLRRRRSVIELFDAVNAAYQRSEATINGLASLAMVTAALGQLEHRGLVERVGECLNEKMEKETEQQRRIESLFNSAFSVPIHYRKVPTRPLKASKCWKFGAKVLALSSAANSS
ncbi:hypothetical protein CCR75_001798 [Bremia lactucae]|uniref:Uncharacterized protein n=1 Tax=Bremia lactucae TaxID=4779 RepID=A0A976IH89_BRELC|nr:hypothetical protein CCR75_001798 [Bremia lactucae]